MLATLGQAHKVGIVHRDVKPSNIMVSYGGEVKLLDFGIARRLDDLAGEVTAAGEVVGTPTYLAPEQIEGRPTTPATDVYAVSVVLFEMVAGVAPFHGDGPVATALAHSTAPVPDVRSLRPDVPEWLAAVISKAMAKDPADRFADAAAMHAALTDSSANSTAVLRRPAGSSEPRRCCHTRLRPPPAPAVVAGRRRRFGSRRPRWLECRDGSVLVHHQRRPTRSPIGTGIADEHIGGSDNHGGANDDRRGDRRSPSQSGRLRTATHHEIVDELVKIEEGDAPSERAANLLDNVAEWVDNTEVTPVTLELLEPVLTPLLETPPDVDGDNGANGNGGGNGTATETATATATATPRATTRRTERTTKPSTAADDHSASDSN